MKISLDRRSKILGQQKAIPGGLICAAVLALALTAWGASHTRDSDAGIDAWNWTTTRTPSPGTPRTGRLVALTLVPEPATLIAGAILLTPFALSTWPILRRRLKS
jgi:hypothetical protein